MARIDQETVNRILDTADIVDVVSDFVKLRRSGANYKGLCPFHNERTPSFSVNKARNICKCFSCGKGGSPVNFIMEHEQLGYQDALRYLARKYNIEIVEKEQTAEEVQAQNRREAMLAVNEFALKHFEHNLLETDQGRDIALAYFRHRGMSDSMIKRFHLGYALDKGTDFLDAAREAGFSDNYLIDTGLSGVSEKEGQRRLYDRFRGRVIFPVHSLSGRVIAFGGRTMRSDKTLAKYVNSPESEIYKKSNELYGLYQAKNAIARRDKCILVEGYFDVISMHQAGVENVVASSGTSLTEGQIRVIRRFSNNVTLIYDADPAGIKASLRGIDMLLAEKLDVKVLLLPPGDDPDSFAQNHSASEVEAYLAENERDIIAFKTEVLMRDVPENDPTARARVVNEILRSIAHVDDVVKRQEYISQTSRMLKIPEEVLVRQLNVIITGKYEEDARNAAREQARASAASIIGDNQDENTDKPASESDSSGRETPLLNLDSNRLRPYEQMLMRYLVRYGLLYFVELPDSSGVKVPMTVFDVISGEMSLDGATFSYPPYADTFEAIRSMRDNGIWEAERKARHEQIESEAAAYGEELREVIRREGGSIDKIAHEETEITRKVEEFRQHAIEEFDIQYTQTHLVNSPVDSVRNTAAELLVDKYTLSKFYTRNGDDLNEQSQLGALVPAAICELRNAMVSDIIKELTCRLADPANSSNAPEILRQISEYKEYQRQLASALGSRIILPKNR
ncbi:MAG: DNA primase [Muribaculaceae bacterium]|nr:DNA primase [Muribaculaceae bacterium]